MSETERCDKCGSPSCCAHWRASSRSARRQLAGAVAALREWLAASEGLKAVDTRDGEAIEAALARVDAAKAAARNLAGGQ